MTERKTIYLDDAIEAIRKLPNAGIHWFVSAEAVFDVLLKLPSAKEQSELGEWVYEERKRLDDETDDGPLYVTQKWWTCSKCGFDIGFLSSKPSDKYCPMCGDKKR